MRAVWLVTVCGFIPDLQLQVDSERCRGIGRLFGGSPAWGRSRRPGDGRGGDRGTVPGASCPPRAESLARHHSGRAIDVTAVTATVRLTAPARQRRHESKQTRRLGIAQPAATATPRRMQSLSCAVTEAA